VTVVLVAPQALLTSPQVLASLFPQLEINLPVLLPNPLVVVAAMVVLLLAPLSPLMKIPSMLR
jgi:hypothetical protein